jgi:hypothetical protein
MPLATVMWETSPKFPQPELSAVLLPVRCLQQGL